MPILPTSKIAIYPFHMRDGGYRELRDGLTELTKEQVYGVYHDGKYRMAPDKLLINWGCSTIPDWWNPALDKNVLNQPQFIKNAVNKIRTFQWLQAHGVDTVPYTLKREKAEEWIKAGYNVFCREKIEGKAGAGIVVAHNLQELVDAKLYTQMIENPAREFRVHVVCGEAIDIQEKRTKKKIKKELIDREVRSHKLGWVFCRQNVVKPKGIDELAVNAVKALGLDFGGVDIIYSELTDKCYVLEVNTAPGIEGSTVPMFAKAFEKYYKENF